jgi:hypothetical protein
MEMMVCFPSASDDRHRFVDRLGRQATRLGDGLVRSSARPIVHPRLANGVMTDLLVWFLYLYIFL